MQTNEPTRRPLISIREAAELAGVTESTGYRWVYAGELPGAVRINGRWYVRRGVLEAWLLGGGAADGFAAQG